MAWLAGSPSTQAEGMATLFSRVEDKAISAPCPTVLPREPQIDPAVLEERRAQIMAQRQLKREQRSLEAKKVTLEEELASVKENLESVTNRKRRLTRSTAAIVNIQPDQNRVFAVPMSEADVEHRSLSAATRRAFEESRRQVAAAKAHSSSSQAGRPHPQTSAQERASAESTPAPVTRLHEPPASLVGFCGALLSSAAEAVATPVLGWLGGAAAAPAAKPAVEVATRAMRVTAYKRFWYLHGGASERCGPVTAAELRREWSKGAVTSTTKVFAANGTMRTWLTVAQVPALHAFLRKPAVPGGASRAEAPTL